METNEKPTPHGAAHGAEFIAVLMRIALALETIAENGETDKRKFLPFPFHDGRVSPRLKSRVSVWNEQHEKQIKTFADFIDTGRKVFMYSRRFPNLGERSVRAIDPIFAENGLLEEWLAS